jgi:hypothetical protein
MNTYFFIAPYTSIVAFCSELSIALQKKELN